MLFFLLMHQFYFYSEYIISILFKLTIDPLLLYLSEIGKIPGMTNMYITLM